MACNSLDKIGLSSGMVSETKRPYEIGGFVDGITPSHASYQVLTNTSSGMVKICEKRVPRLQGSFAALR
jgi:hypothetical protein